MTNSWFKMNQIKFFKSFSLCFPTKCEKVKEEKFFYEIQSRWGLKCTPHNSELAKDTNVWKRKVSVLQTSLETRDRYPGQV